MKKCICALILLGSLPGLAKNKAVKPVRVLFIGNSYIYYNDLPDMTSRVAESYGQQLQVDSHTPGGFTLKQQSAAPDAIAKIKQGNWTYVVLQDQSEAPAAPIRDVESNTYPYARFLDSLAKKYSPQARSIFYMTWGRKNGDMPMCEKWPDVCTYEGMDNLLAERYRIMTQTNHAILSPVGAVWRYIRKNYPQIELYNEDGSHPSEAGTYAAACTFATVIFKKDPLLIKYDSKLAGEDTEKIRKAVRAVVFDHLKEWYY